MQKAGALTQTVAPVNALLEASEVKQRLRICSGEDDADIANLITAANDLIENYTHRQLITATFTYKLDEFPANGEPIILPKPPLQSVSSITYVDTNGDSQTWSSSNYVVDTDSDEGHITLAWQQCYPDTRDQRNAVTITFVAGYGNDSSDVPENLRLAAKLLVGHYYENREDTTTLSLNEIPLSFKALADQYKVRYVL